jgi:hypothetical protein
MFKSSLTGADQIAPTMRRELESLMKQVGDEVLNIAKKETPVRSGNARKNWTKEEQASSFTVENRVPYIERLEAGSSRQAPRGMIMPTLTQIKGKYK